MNSVSALTISSHTPGTQQRSTVPHGIPPSVLLATPVEKFGLRKGNRTASRGTSGVKRRVLAVLRHPLRGAATFFKKLTPKKRAVPLQSRRDFLRLVGLGSAATALAACAGSGAPVPAPVTNSTGSRDPVVILSPEYCHDFGVSQSLGYTVQKFVIPHMYGDRKDVALSSYNGEQTYANIARRNNLENINQLSAGQQITVCKGDIVNNWGNYIE